MGGRSSSEGKGIVKGPLVLIAAFWLIAACSSGSKSDTVVETIPTPAVSFDQIELLAPTATLVTPTPVPTATPTPLPTATPTPVPNPSVQIIIRGIGVTRSHEGQGIADFFGGPDDVTLLVRIDEAGKPPVIIMIPRGAELTKETLPVFAEAPVVLEETVFEISSVSDTFRFQVAAIEGDDSSWIGGAVAAFGVITGGVGVIVAGSALDGFLGPSETLIGMFDGTWDKSNDWGRGSYINVGTDDLKLTFDVVVDGRMR